MDSNSFCWLPPTHPVIKNRISGLSVPWSGVDWYSVDSSYWWKRGGAVRSPALSECADAAAAPGSNTGGKVRGNDKPAGQKTLIDHLGLVFYDWAVLRQLFLLNALGENLSEDLVIEPVNVRKFVDWLLNGSGVRVVPDCAVASGLNRYDARMFLQDDSGVRMGHVLWGGEHQSGTLNLHLTGAACSVISESSAWATLQARVESMHGDFSERFKINRFNQSGGARISRIDVAWDDFEGEYSIERIVDLYKDGMFQTRGRPPSSSCAGDWLGGCGRTFYVGKRENLCYWRSYEKGHQVGDADSKWVRHEIEFKRKGLPKGVNFPLSVLTEPDTLFCFAYDKLTSLMIGSASPADLRRPVAVKIKTTIERAVSNIRTQWGRYIRVLRDVVGLSPEDMLSALVSEDSVIPAGLSLVSVGDVGFAVRSKMTTA